MVSTRGLKYKFSDGEKVLCYEPDPTKAKVLYDSKVLDVIVNKDQRGRKAVEYLIHFQGWNSSWDRCVTEEYVLKDTEENRQLQRDLAQKAQLQLGAYLYRKERKKRSHKYSDRSIDNSIENKRSKGSTGSRATSATTGSSEDGSSEQQEDYDTEDIVSEDTESSSEEMEGTSEDEGSRGGSHSSSSSKAKIEIDFSPAIKKLLENDHELIVKKNKIILMPVQPNVYDILESWVHQYTISQLTNIIEKSQGGKRQSSSDKVNVDKAVRDIVLCRQAADGLRIYFDVYLAGILLYLQEKEQFLNFSMSSITDENELILLKDECAELDVKEEVEVIEFAHLPPFQETETETEKNNSLKRVLRSSRLSSAEEQKVIKPVIEEPKPEPGNISSLASTSSRCSSPRGITLRTATPVINSLLIDSILEKCKKWKLMPDNEKREAYIQSKPSMIYGAQHLLRLIVKIPEILRRTNIRGPKLKALLKKFDSLVHYIEEHKEWFDDQMYVVKTNCSNEQPANS